MAETWVINADSTPDLDDWGWDDYWGPGEWIKWHAAMKKKYGRDEANYRLVKAYNEASMGAANYDWRTFNTDFKNYAKKEGFYNGLFEGIGAIAKPISTGVTVVDAAGNVVDSTTTGITRTAKILKWALPTAAGLGLIALAGYAISQYRKATQ